MEEPGVEALLARAARDEEETRRRLEVHKELELEFDLGNLLAVDRNPPTALRAAGPGPAGEAALRALARDNAQLLVNRLWAPAHALAAVRAPQGHPPAQAGQPGVGRGERRVAAALGLPARARRLPRVAARGARRRRPARGPVRPAPRRQAGARGPQRAEPPAQPGARARAAAAPQRRGPAPRRPPEPRRAGPRPARGPGLHRLGRPLPAAPAPRAARPARPRPRPPAPLPARARGLRRREAGPAGAAARPGQQEARAGRDPGRPQADAGGGPGGGRQEEEQRPPPGPEERGPAAARGPGPGRPPRPGRPEERGTRGQDACPAARRGWQEERRRAAPRREEAQVTTPFARPGAGSRRPGPPTCTPPPRRDLG